MATFPVRLLLFLSAYAPLWVIWGVKALSLRDDYALAFVDIDLLWIAVALFAISLLGLLLLLRFLHSVRQREAHHITVVDVFPKSGEMLGYIAPYFLPFLKLEVTDLVTQIALVVLFAMLATVYVRLNLVHVNPLLSGMGFHLFEVKAKSGRRYWLLTKRTDIRLNERVSIADIGPSAAIELSK